MKRSMQLKQLLLSNKPEFIMEAHSGLSAKIVEQAGFQAIWASSLTISALLGLRDCNEASWTQVLEICEFMADAVDIPILLDADTGYGNFNNFRRLIHKLEQRGIAGVCIEDKIFPKMNSFVRGETQQLASIDEMCGKIRCAKDTQKDPDFVVVARTEGFIVGQPIEEVLARAHAFCAAGADALLIHSKQTSEVEIEAFMGQWQNECPIVIAPTTYYQTPAEHFQKLKISAVIWANHLLRSSITAMKTTAEKIYQEQSVQGVENHIASITEIFELQNIAELQQAELQYLPSKKNESS